MKDQISRNLKEYDVLWSPKDNAVYLIKGRHASKRDLIPTTYSVGYEKKDPEFNMVYIVLHGENGAVTGLMADGASNCWINRKNLEYYSVTGLAIDATNSIDGRIKVVYTKNGNVYVRDIYEFLSKFMPKFDSLQTIEPEEVISMYSSTIKEVIEEVK